MEHPFEKVEQYRRLSLPLPPPSVNTSWREMADY